MWTFYCFLLQFLALSFAQTFKSAPCNLRTTRYGSICVCNADYCDYLENPIPNNDNDVIVVSSSKQGLRFEVTNAKFGTKEKTIIRDYTKISKKRKRSKSTENPTEFDPVILDIIDAKSYLRYRYESIFNRRTEVIQIFVNREKSYQQIVGFGGAFTGSVSYLLQQMDTKLQDQLYSTYFHKTNGIGYSIIRMPIGGSDFDLAPWAYNENPSNDVELSNFNKLDPRDEIRVEQIKRLMQVAGLNDIKIMALAWSSPPWMKSNNDWTGFSYLKPEYYDVWAKYHLRFLELMDAKNMPIWAISTGNEPLNGVVAFFFVHFMSLGWTPRNQAIWLNDNLGPTIKNSKFKNVKIFGNEDQRFTFPKWFQKMNESRANSLNYLDGIAVHWYWDDVFDVNLIEQTHATMQNKIVFNTESCIGDKPWEIHGPELGSWERGEKYFRSYMQDLKSVVNGWIDWNLVLNEKGGPNYVGNTVDAPIVVNTTTQQEFYKQPIFYAIGHYSKFITENSKRIDTQIVSSYIDAVSFQRPDQKIVTVIFNSGNVALDIALNDSKRGVVLINIPARSMHTIIYN